MGLQRVAPAVVAPVPCRLRARFGFGFESGGDQGELDLVTEEPAPDAPVVVLGPAKVAVGVDPGPTEALVLAAAPGGAHSHGAVAQLFVRSTLVE